MNNYNSTDKKLRFAIIGDNKVLQSWQVLCLNELLTLEYVEPVAFIKPDFGDAKKSFFSKYFSSTFLYRLRNKYFIHKLQLPEPLSTRLNNCLVVNCKIIRKGKHSDYFEEQSITEIKKLKLDFIIRFGLNIIRGEALNIAKFGIWSYHHGDPFTYRGGPPCFWEVYKKEKTHGAILQRLTNKLDSGIILREGCFEVINHSYRHTLDNCYKQTSYWIKQVCIDIYNNNASYLNANPISSCAKIYKFPTNHIMVLYAFKKVIRKMQFHFHNKFKAEIWLLHTGKNEGNYYESKINYSQTIKHPKSNSYYADPFLISENGNDYIVCEDYNYKNRKGKLVLLSKNEKFDLTTDSHHYSYPFTLKHNNKWFCMPEQAEKNKISIYEIDLINKKLINEKVIIDNVSAYDPTLFFYKEKWWLFFTMKATGTSTALHIWYADAVFGKYISHANNPVKQNIGNSRPGGRIFINDTIVIRPTQNCSKTYGGNLVFNAIQVLNTTQFEEKPVNTLFPPENQYGLHHIDMNEHSFIIDTKIEKYTLSKLF